MLRAGGTDVPEIRPPVFTKSDIRMSESVRRALNFS
jgi:hypothetical protein